MSRLIFSEKKKKKKGNNNFRMSLLQILFGTLRVKVNMVNNGLVQEINITQFFLFFLFIFLHNYSSLMLTLGKISADNILKYFSYFFFSKNRI